VEKGFGGGEAAAVLAFSNVEEEDDDDDEDAAAAARYVRNSATKSRAARSDAVADVRPSYGPGGKANCDIFRRG